ncbi:MAG: hypothetical protein H0U02_13025 [Rubrobacter sp.]|nr:hypothetical protein [Rubrobacter sp.]
MDDIRDIFASMDGAFPERPFASFTGSSAGGAGNAAAAAGTLSRPDGRHYVAYLERPDGASGLSYVDEDLRLHARETPSGIESLSASGYRVRYLEAFSDPFEAGERYRFLWEALHPLPEEDDTQEERERDRRRGLARIEGMIRGKASSTLCDEVLRAEEEESAAATIEGRAFWRQAAHTAREELSRLVPDDEGRERDLALHRYRRAAQEADDSGAGDHTESA